MPHDSKIFTGQYGTDGLPELRLTLPDPGDLASTAARAAVRFFSDPENLAAVSGATLLPLMVMAMARKPLPFLPWLVLALMGEGMGIMAYRSYKNLEIIAAAAKADA